MFKSKTCQDCGPLPENHFEKYLESFFEYLLPKIRRHHILKIGNLIDKLFLAAHLLEKEAELPDEKISLRSTVFINEAKKHGMKFWVLQGALGHYLNFFHFEYQNKIHHFEGLPCAEFLESPVSSRVDDKAKVKEILLQNRFPTTQGTAFWFFQKSRALRYGVQLGFPLMVKPRSGSISRHITTNIQSEGQLQAAIKKAVCYEPCFIIEKYLPNTKVFRTTVVDKKFIACVERIPAHVVGDGQRTIRELIQIKNSEPRRGKPKQKDTTLYKLVVDGTTEQLLQKQNLTLNSVPPTGKQIFLQEKVILDLGADLKEVTPFVHSDNLQLFQKVAELFNVYLVGIDFLISDISKSWRSQPSAIIELNSLPYIDMHHFPTEGAPVNVAMWLCDMVKKYY